MLCQTLTIIIIIIIIIIIVRHTSSVNHGVRQKMIFSDLDEILKSRFEVSIISSFHFLLFVKLKWLMAVIFAVTVVIVVVLDSVRRQFEALAVVVGWYYVQQLAGWRV